MSGAPDSRVYPLEAWCVIMPVDEKTPSSGETIMKRPESSVVLAVGFVLLGSRTAVAGPTVTGRVPADWPADRAVPVVVPVPESLSGEPVLAGQVQVDGRPRGAVVLQTEPADPTAGTPARAWFTWTANPEHLGKPLSIELKPGSAAPAPICRVRRDDPNVHVTDADGKLILAYRHGPADPAMPKAMTSYIHPLVGLDGEILTDCSPKDHLHHRGLFWSWVRIMRDGKLLGETWIPRDITLQPADLRLAEGPVMGRFAARHLWLHDPGAPGKPSGNLSQIASDPSARLFQEDVICRVFAASRAGRAIDVDLTLTALQDGLEIGGQTQLNKGYGGLTVRFSTDQKGKAKEPKVVADGKPVTEATVNHLKALWVDWTGVFEGPDGKPLSHRSGGALFVHPSHPPLPKSAPEWITRFYGPINVAYPGLEMLAVPRDKPVRLKYRIWLHREDAAESGVDGEYRAYAADWNWRLVP